MNALNGYHDSINGDDHPDSPMADSPATPVNTATSVNVKINGDNAIDSTEPISIKIDAAKFDASSTRPAVGTPLDPASIPVDPPHGTPPPPPGQLLDDVRMAEQETPMDEDVPTTNGDVNGNGHSTADAGTPVSIQNGSSTTAVDSNVHEFSANDDDGAQPPPAKRARKSSDADRASAHSPATAPPASPSSSHAFVPAPPVVDNTPREMTLSVAQHKFAVSTIRTIKKSKDSAPFKFPVDPVALNIPHYPKVITKPMDLSTVELKLAASNPIKPDPNPKYGRYYSADEFISDVRLIFDNCLTFNGPDHVVTQCGRRVEAVFHKMIKQMPPPEAPKPPVVKKVVSPPPPPPVVAPSLPAAAASKKSAARRQSVSVPTIRRNEENPARPKREIHPPPPKDLPYADAPKKARRGSKSGKSLTDQEQLKFCGKVLDALNRKSHANIVAPFAQPVDPIALGIPDYPKIVKKPMDLSTMRAKLDAGQYPTADKFRDDFKLMMANCFAYNSELSPVHKAGVDLQKLFEEKWRSLPQPKVESEDEEEEDEDEDEDERARAIAAMESQIETMRSNISALKSMKPSKKEKKKEKAPKTPSAPVASSSKPPKKENKAASKKKNGGGKKNGASASQPVAEDDTLTFEQKKDLSDAITRIDGQKLERVIQIIHEGVPEIRDSQEEIELEIDLLPPAVLTKLYNFVLRPIRQAQIPKKARTGKGTGTGGLKRKSMDEDAEAEKIRRLEAQMALFEQQANGGATNGSRADMMAAAPAAAGHDSDGSSDSSSDDDSSGSDSE